MSPRSETSILFLLSSLAIGGSEGKTVRLAGSLAAGGAHVALAYLDAPEDLLARIDPRVTVIALRRRGKFSPGALRRLIQTIRTRAPATVVAVNLYAALYVLCARLFLGRRRFRFLASVNTTEFVTGKQARQMHLYSRVLRRADLIVFGAQAQRRAWFERYAGLRDARTAVLYNGVDIERFTQGATPPWTGAGRRPAFLIGTVGALRMEKAHDHLVRATAALRARGLDVGAVIVGDGTERDRLLAEIERLRLQDHVLVAGAAADVRPYLAAMDVFVLTSIGVETFSNAVLEAMASGVPVVSSAIGGMEELLARGGGVTYPPGDIERLVDLLGALLRDPARRSELARAARRAAVEHFSWSRMVEEFAALTREASPRLPAESRAPRALARRRVRSRT